MNREITKLDRLRTCYVVIVGNHLHWHKDAMVKAMGISSTTITKIMNELGIEKGRQLPEEMVEAYSDEYLAAFRRVKGRGPSPRKSYTWKQGRPPVENKKPDEERPAKWFDHI